MTPDLFHVALPDEWAADQQVGEYRRSTRGRTLEDEGYIHCSFAHQVAAVVERFYADLPALVLLRIDPSRLTAPLVVEDLFDVGEPFPHVYGPIPLDAIVGATDVTPTSVRDGRR